MKLKHVVSGLEEKKADKDESDGYEMGFCGGHNQLCNLEVEVDEGKIVCFLNSLQEYRPERDSKYSKDGTQYLCRLNKTDLTKALAKAISEGSILRVKR